MQEFLQICRKNKIPQSSVSQTDAIKYTLKLLENGETLSQRIKLTLTLLISSKSLSPPLILFDNCYHTAKDSDPIGDGQPALDVLHNGQSYKDS